MSVSYDGISCTITHYLISDIKWWFLANQNASLLRYFTLLWDIQNTEIRACDWWRNFQEIRQYLTSYIFKEFLDMCFKRQPPFLKIYINTNDFFFTNDMLTFLPVNWSNVIKLKYAFNSIDQLVSFFFPLYCILKMN